MLQNVGPNIDYFPTLHQCQISARSYLRTRKAKVLSSPPPEKSPTDVKSWTKLFSQISRNLIPAIVEGTLNTIPLWFISGASQSGCSRFSNWTLKPLRNKMRRLSLALYNRWAIFFHETAKERHVHTCIWRNIVTSRLSPKKNELSITTAHVEKQVWVTRTVKWCTSSLLLFRPLLWPFWHICGNGNHVERFWLHLDTQSWLYYSFNSDVIWENIWRGYFCVFRGSSSRWSSIQAFITKRKYRCSFFLEVLLRWQNSGMKITS